VSYGAAVASAFGVRARILTIAGPEADLSPLEGHDVALVRDRGTVTFAFTEGPDGRAMRVPEQPSRPLAATDLPDAWRTPSTLLIAPLILGDVDVDSFAPIASSASQVGVVMQGLQRELVGDEVQITSPRDNALVRTCSHSYSLFRSRREAAQWTDEQTEAVTRCGAALVTTLGSAGAEIRRGNDRLAVDPFPLTSEGDSTGAGDVFATALILALDEGEQAAAQIAAAFAAASVEQVGPQPLPTLDEIKQRIASVQSEGDANRRGDSV
jgi:sugar/nucleoside kinase (ribokinase family)